MKKALFIFVVLLATTCKAQQFGWLEGNDVRMRVFSNGHIGWADTIPWVGYYVPADSLISPLFSAGLWIGGMDPQGTVRSFAQSYLIDEQEEVFPGPLAVGTAFISPATSAAYDRVWTVSAEEVLQHSAWADCVADPDCDETVEFPDYSIPDDFIQWPAHGDQQQGQAEFLAPFFDRNGNGSYEPAFGDHPCVPGDQAAYVIFNDNLAPSTYTAGLPLGLEIHMTAFSYSNEDPAIDQTVFVHYRMINRSDTAYQDVYVGTFADMDIGCPVDDFIGSDVGRNMMFTYNWDDIDEQCLFSPGYGVTPPAFGINVLKGPLLVPDGYDDLYDISLPAYNGTGFGDGTLDNERAGMHSMVYFNREGYAAMTDPSNDQHVYNYLQAIWKDGMHLTYGGTGYPGDTSAVEAQFMFPWDSDPMGVGTEGIPMPSWVETSQGNLVDRRGIMGSGPFMLPAGGEQDILFGYVYARASSGGATASVEALKLRVDSVKAFAQTIPGIMAPGQLCEGIITGIESFDPGYSTLLIHPNPAADQIIMKGTSLSKGRIQLYDLHGSLVAQRSIASVPAVLNVQDLRPGVYFLRYEMKDRNVFGRFIKE